MENLNNRFLLTITALLFFINISKAELITLLGKERNIDNTEFVISNNNEKNNLVLGDIDINFSDQGIYNVNYNITYNGKEIQLKIFPTNMVIVVGGQKNTFEFPLIGGDMPNDGNISIFNEKEATYFLINNIYGLNLSENEYDISPILSNFSSFLNEIQDILKANKINGGKDFNVFWKDIADLTRVMFSLNAIYSSGENISKDINGYLGTELTNLKNMGKQVSLKDLVQILEESSLNSGSYNDKFIFRYKKDSKLSSLKFKQHLIDFEDFFNNDYTLEENIKTIDEMINNPDYNYITKQALLLTKLKLQKKTIDSLDINGITEMGTIPLLYNLEKHIKRFENEYMVLDSEDASYYNLGLMNAGYINANGSLQNDISNFLKGIKDGTKDNVYFYIKKNYPEYEKDIEAIIKLYEKIYGKPYGLNTQKYNTLDDFCLDLGNLMYEIDTFYGSIEGLEQEYINNYNNLNILFLKVGKD